MEPFSGIHYSSSLPMFLLETCTCAAEDAVFGACTAASGAVDPGYRYTSDRDKLILSLGAAVVGGEIFEPRTQHSKRCSSL